MKKVLFYILGGILLLLAGAALVFFLLYQPMVRELQELQSEHTVLQDAAYKLEDDLTAMTADRDAQVALLNKSQADLDAANQQVARNEQISFASGMQVEVMTASQKLQAGDVTAAKAALALAEQYMLSLSGSLDDQSIGESLAGKVAGIRSLLETDAVRAVAEMDNLIISLHQIIQTLQLNSN